mmetsp:Transcript_122352/g.345853  ORF Transcript_122352/g.345853 Transcript_122352/m.345853 type:complete len:217 (-) Transcript_122352:36-686(-)
MPNIMTSTRMMTRRVVMSDNFFPMRVSGSSELLLSLFCSCSLGRSLSWTPLPCIVSLSSSAPSSSKSSFSSSSISNPPESRFMFRLAFSAAFFFFKSMAVLYVLYNFTRRSNLIMRTVLPVLATARLSWLFFATSLSASPVAQYSASPTQVKSNANVTVEIVSKKKKKPRKYSGFPRQAATTSKPKMKIHPIVMALKALSVTLGVAARRKSSPNKA